MSMYFSDELKKQRMKKKISEQSFRDLWITVRKI